MEYNIPKISENDFLAVGELITRRYGIRMPAEKKIMFQSRLHSRLRELNIESYDEYCQFVLNPQNTERELSAMINFISTNKTEFFRESEHFFLLRSEILPELFGRTMTSQGLVRCWSAGCSSGQEAFSMAMELEEFKREYKGGVDYNILGTDVSAKVLDVAKKGIYPFSQSTQIPENYLSNYVLKSKDTQKPRIKIIKTIRSKVVFNHGNLMDTEYQFDNTFELIFLRNTLIYFSRKDQMNILRNVLSHLNKGGYLFIGHSESLINFDLPIRTIAPSLYQKY